MRELAEVPEGDREQALARFRLLEAHLSYGQELRSLADASGVSVRTLQRWVAQYRKDGIVALVRRVRGDRGVLRMVSPTMKSAIEGLALEKPPLPVSSIYRQIRQFAVQSAEPAPSYGTVYALVRSLPADLLTLAHRGTRAYSQIYDLVHRREASRSNAVWQVDHALEQVRSIFDESEVGLILIGMPGVEKRMARLPQFYSRIGFVHEFCPLGTEEVQNLLETGWAPSGVALPLEAFKPDVLAAIIHMTSGNFRLLNRLLTQIERLLKLNEAQTTTLEIVDAARESLVIGQA